MLEKKEVCELTDNELDLVVGGKTDKVDTSELDKLNNDENNNNNDPIIQ